MHGDRDDVCMMESITAVDEKKSVHVTQEDNDWHQTQYHNFHMDGSKKEERETMVCDVSDIVLKDRNASVVENDHRQFLNQSTAKVEERKKSIGSTKTKGPNITHEAKHPSCSKNYVAGFNVDKGSSSKRNMVPIKDIEVPSNYKHFDDLKENFIQMNHQKRTVADNHIQDGRPHRDSRQTQYQKSENVISMDASENQKPEMIRNEFESITFQILDESAFIYDTKTPKTEREIKDKFRIIKDENSFELEQRVCMKDMVHKLPFFKYRSDHYDDSNICNKSCTTRLNGCRVVSTDDLAAPTTNKYHLDNDLTKVRRKSCITITKRISTGVDNLAESIEDCVNLVRAIEIAAFEITSKENKRNKRNRTKQEHEINADDSLTTKLDECKTSAMMISEGDRLDSRRRGISERCEEERKLVKLSVKYLMQNEFIGI